MTFVIHAHPLIAADTLALAMRQALERGRSTPVPSKR